MPVKTLEPRVKESSSPVEDPDLLTLQSLEAHPAVRQVIEEKEPLSDRLATLEEAMRQCRQRIVLYSQKGQPDPAVAATLANETRERLQTLEHEHAQTIAELRTANAAIAEARERTQAALMPALRQLALPVIDRRLADLAVLGTVARLLGTKTPARSMRENHTQEKRYLEELRAVLTAEDN